jgi:hypothetical protein
MTPMIVAVGSGIAWFIFFIVAHISWAHALSDRHYGRIIQRCWMLAAIGSIITVGFLHNKYWPHQLLSCAFAECVTLLLLACAFITYVPFVFVISTSLSVDTLIVLERAAGQLERAKLYGRFASTAAAQRRLEVMRTNGLVSPNTNYQLTNKARRIAHFFSWMKQFWKLEPGG